MSTHLPWFPSFFSFLSSFHVNQISNLQLEGQEYLKKLLSGSMIHLTIAMELRMVGQKKKVFGSYYVQKRYR